MESRVRYFEDWGFEALEQNVTGAEFKTPSNMTVPSMDPSSIMEIFLWIRIWIGSVTV